MTQRIRSPVDHKKFLASKSKVELLAFINRLNKSCFGQREAREESAVALRLITTFETIRLKVDEIPASHGRVRRFGDATFRQFCQWLVETAPELISNLTNTILSIQEKYELATYLVSSFGDQQRLDYGTGHETAQIIFLLCLYKLGILLDRDIDSGAVALTVLKAYFVCCRRIQSEYLLEPAGSRGVWALDDYQCLAFLFGSAQHIGISVPAQYTIENELNIDLVRSHESYSLFFQGIAYAQLAKDKARRAPFAETSPVLFAFSSKSWIVINRAILKYYESEVLGTFVVARHLRFGTLFPASWLSVNKRKDVPIASSLPVERQNNDISNSPQKENCS